MRKHVKQRKFHAARDTGYVLRLVFEAFDDILRAVLCEELRLQQATCHCTYLVAAKWWSNQLVMVPPPNIDAFRTELTKILNENYRGHWYEEDPIRGSAFRALSFDQHLDPRLWRAGEAAGITDIERKLYRVRDYIMWVNPGQVRVRAGGELGIAKSIWSRADPDLGVPVRDDDEGNGQSDTPTGTDGAAAGRVRGAASDIPAGEAGPENGEAEGDLRGDGLDDTSLAKGDDPLEFEE